MPRFQDRKDAIFLICDKTAPYALLNIYGERGIGKSRLLQEAAQRLQAQQPAADDMGPLLHDEIDEHTKLTFLVNLEPLRDMDEAQRPAFVLRAMLEQVPPTVDSDVGDSNANPEKLAGQLISRLSALARHMQIVVMFDTTESVQDDTAFWRWMELKLVGPLVLDGHVRQVFAGRIPVPWRRFEVKRTLKLLSLQALPQDPDASALVREVLAQHNPDLVSAGASDQANDLVLAFSYGHPLLSEQLAEFVARHWPIATPLAAYQRALCEQVVKPFIQQDLFKHISDEWQTTLWWASVLDWFDATVLQRYIQHVDPALAQGHEITYYIQGITQLRLRNTTLWREARGDRLYGVIADIVRQCFKTMQPEHYHRALCAAVGTLETFAAEFADDDPGAQYYRDEAAEYRRRDIQEVERWATPS